MSKPVMYEWPESQICMECKHGEFITSDRLFNSNYLCMVGCDKNDGVNCPKRPPKGAVKEVEISNSRINGDGLFECSLFITLHDGKVLEMDVESMTKTEDWSQGDE